MGQVKKPANKACPQPIPSASAGAMMVGLAALKEPFYT